MRAKAEARCAVELTISAEFRDPLDGPQGRAQRGQYHHRPRPQHDAGPYDAPGGIVNVLAVHYGSTGLFCAYGYEPNDQQRGFFSAKVVVLQEASHKIASSGWALIQIKAGHHDLSARDTGPVSDLGIEGHRPTILIHTI